jgi:hypothetical protein
MYNLIGRSASGSMASHLALEEPGVLHTFALQEEEHPTTPAFRNRLEARPADAKALKENA